MVEFPCPCINGEIDDTAVDDAPSAVPGDVFVPLEDIAAYEEADCERE